MHIVPGHLKARCLEWYRLMMETWIVCEGFPRPDAVAQKLMAGIEDTWADETQLIREDIGVCVDNNVDPLTGGSLSGWRLNPRGV